MEDNIKAIELKNKKHTKKVLNILEKLDTNNIYLLEGIISENPGTKNLLFYSGNELISVVHIKLNRYAHIQSFTEEKKLNINYAIQLKTMFPEIRSLFGDKTSISFFKKSYMNNIYKIIDYSFMELSKRNFNPIDYNNYSGISEDNFNVSLNAYPEIVRLQKSYEVEELEIEPSKIKTEILEKVIDLRIKKGEMTVLKIDDIPVGIASINARYKNTCQIGSVYIDKNYRGKSYGALLLSEHIKRLYKKFNRIVLFVRKSNKIAYNLYRKLGFISKGELEQLILKTEHD